MKQYETFSSSASRFLRDVITKLVSCIVFPADFPGGRARFSAV